MKCVFVNHAHPDVTHVSSMRLSCLAHAMARRGHRVVLLTGESPRTPGIGMRPGDLAGLMAGHDWTSPLVVPVADCPPQQGNGSDRELPSLMRRIRTAWRLVCGEGVNGTWVRSATPMVQALVKAFRPDVVWGTFGNTSNLLLAQSVGRAAHCPWVADIKDNWHEFVPRGLRAAVAWRFRDVAALTSNAHFHLAIANRLFRKSRATVVYSGVADPFYGLHVGDQARQRSREIVLVGSTYSAQNLGRFLAALATWMNALSMPERAGLIFRYAGSDSRQVVRALDENPLPCEVLISTQLTLTDLSELTRGALANCYLAAATGFHHKLLELLVVGRPVICFPGEQPESMELASQSTTPFHVCGNEADLRAALDAVWRARAGQGERGAAPKWGWDDMVGGLEDFLGDVVRSGGTRCAA